MPLRNAARPPTQGKLSVTCGLLRGTDLASVPDLTRTRQRQAALMPHVLTSAQIAELLDTLCGSYDVTLGCGELRLLARSLPGNAVCAILPDTGDGVFRVVYDTAKPNAFQHTQAMLRDWWESFAEPEVFPDGTVELVGRICPSPRSGPIRVARVR